MIDQYYYPIVLTLVFITIFYFLRLYASGGATPRFVYAVVAAGWATSLSVVVLVPIDVYKTLNDLDPKQLVAPWRLAYWSTFLLTFLVIPFFQIYHDSGEFTICSKVLSAIKVRIKILAITAVVGGLLLIIVHDNSNSTWQNLEATLVVMANVWGLVAGLVLLGFGLIEIPRVLWRNSYLEDRLNRIYNLLGRQAETLSSAENELSIALRTVQAISLQTSQRDSLRPLVNILEKIAKLAQTNGFEVRNVSGQEVDVEDFDNDEVGLVKLHQKLRRAIHKYDRTKGLYMQLLREALDLDEIVSIKDGTKKLSLELAASSVPSFNWLKVRLVFARAFYQVHLQWIGHKLLAFLFAALSLAILVAETAVATRGRPDLSLISWLISRYCKNPFTIVFLVVLPSLAYVCFAAYFSLFRLGRFSFYQLVPRHSDPYSLLLNSTLMARFAAPLSYNFLHMINVVPDIHIERPQCPKQEDPNTSFSQVMEAMNEIPVFGSEFNQWVPILVVIIALTALSNVINRLFSFLGKGFVFRVDSNSDADYSERGRTIIQNMRSKSATSPAVLEDHVSLLALESGSKASSSAALASGNGGVGRRNSNNKAAKITNDEEDEEKDWDALKARLREKAAESRSQNKKSGRDKPSLTNSIFDTERTSLFKK